MTNFMVAVERKSVLNKGVYPVRILEFYLIPENELKPKNKKFKSGDAKKNK